ncbi:MAG TPA: hypothetical protein VG838_07770 [Opitutaceae bacterium]|nr:hypothetical protein [Opitutaceae bacterium]
MRKILSLLPGLMLPLLPATLCAQGRPPTDAVAVSSSASVEYTRQKFGPGAPKPESYLFFQGTFYGGATRDKNLENEQFNQIVQVLGQNMVRQNYFPSKDPRSADLLIVVHWGVTTTAEATEPNLADDRVKLAELSSEYNQALRAYLNGKGGSFPPDPGPVNLQQAIVDGENAEVMKHIAENAKLLGYKDQMYKDETTSVDDHSLYEDLNEERYFVILMAYDYHTMKKGSTPKLLWSTRFSMRAPGNFFTAALPAMSKVAANSFGRAIDGLKIERANQVKEGKVEVGTPEVIRDDKAGK